MILGRKATPDNSRVKLYCGSADSFTGDCDIILTNPYGGIPDHLKHKPMLIADFIERKERNERRTGNVLRQVSSWDKGRCAVWCANMDYPDVDLRKLKPEKEGWFPLELPLWLLTPIAREGMTIWDGYMGRGTTGKACQKLGLNFIGGDIREDRVQLAREYLGVVEP